VRKGKQRRSISTPIHDTSYDTSSPGACQQIFDSGRYAVASIVFGFPSIAALKFYSRSEFCPGAQGVAFFGRADACLSVLSSNLMMLQTLNFRGLRELAYEYCFCLVADVAIGSIFMSIYSKILVASLHYA
jgi:hypothetical protein